MADAAAKGAGAGTGAAARPKTRPKYLNLFELGLSQPAPAVVSILHRVSGALLFVAMVWLLWMLDRSLSSEASFERIRYYVALWPVKLALLALVWAYCHHFCAGIRYLFLDLDRGIDRETARLTSWIVLAAGVVLTALIGWRIW